MASFNVWKEGWIPLRFADGSRREVGIGEVLEKAHLATEIDEPVPTLAYGMYRLLIALVMDLHRFERISQLHDALEKGSFEMAEVEEYHRDNADRFNLFDERFPFLQTAVPASERKKASSVAALLQHIPSGTGATHFVHGLAGEQAWAPAVCARALTAIAPFMTAGGAGYSPSINGAPPWYVLLRGRDLRQTLLLNCWHRRDSPPYKGLGSPAWRETVAITPKDERKTYTLLEGLTWQPRLVSLVPGPGGVCNYSGHESPVLIREMVFTFGLKTGDPEAWRDPHVAYRPDEKKGLAKVMPREGHQAWRNLSAFALARHRDDNASTRPMVLSQLARLLDEGYETGDLELECYGMRTDNMKIFEWHCEGLKVGKGVFTHPNAEAEVGKAMDTVDRYDRLLRNSLKLAYKKYLDPPTRELWEKVRGPFQRQFLHDLGATRHGALEDLNKLQESWEQIVRRDTEAILDSYLDRLGQRPEALLVAAETRKYFLGALRKWSTPLTVKKKGVVKT